MVIVLVAPRLGAQSSAVLRGRTIDSAGTGIAGVNVVVRPVLNAAVKTAPETALEIAHGVSAADGSFQITLSTLPERVAVEADAKDGRSGRTELDSLTVRASIERPVLIHLRGPHALAAVQVRAQYQKRPSVFNFFEGEPSSRVEAVGVVTEWFDPLAAGDAAALLRASPDLQIGADGSASLLGAPSASNQVQIGGVRVPAGLIAGSAGGSITPSPWDPTIGGAAGATVNLTQAPAGRYKRGWIALRSGVGGIPGWAASSGRATGMNAGMNVPVQLSAGATGPIGRFGYRASAFAQTEATSLPRWDRTLGTQQRDVLDSLSHTLGVTAMRAEERRTQAGVIGRLDLKPYSDKRVLALTSALTRSTQTGGTRGGFVTGSLATDAVEDIGLLELESTSIVRERVLWTSLLSTSVASDHVTRASAAPTIIVTDTSGGSTLITGGAAPQPTSNVLAAEARSTGTWYSRDNKTRYVAQLQARFERARLGGRGPHSTFVAASTSALQSGEAISLVRETGSAAATASSFVFAPALGARHDLGARGSILFGIRVDAWTTDGIAAPGTLQYVDVSPRVSFLRRIGTRSANRGAIATLRIGAGRFTDWPTVQQWSDAWTGAGASRELCAGTAVPAITLDTEAPSCVGGGTTQLLGRSIADGGLRPTASNRADVSVAIAEIAPGVRAEFGSALARTSRIAARLSPFVNAPVVGRLTGEDNRAVLIPESAIGMDGIVPVAAIPSGTSDVTRLASDATSTASQWRVKLATKDPFARATWNLTYTFTTGRERSLAVASPAAAPAFVSGPLAVGGRHAFAFSLGEWIGDATIRFAGIARSGARFTPLADRDLNGDGRVNDAVYVPQSQSEAWAGAVQPGVRSCIRAASGRIAAVGGCTGPWSVSSLFLASIPGVRFGLPRGSDLSVQISNPLGVIGRVNGVTFGSPAPVNATLLHVTGFDAATQRFTGEPMRGFGVPLGLSPGISDPVRLAVGIRMPVGPSTTVQRADAALLSLQRDTSARKRRGVALNYLGDLPPVPLVVLQSGEGIQITADQRRALQALGARWQSSAARIVLTAYDERAPAADGRAARERLVRARADFLVEASAITAEIRQLLSADQIDLLSEGVQRLLNPRFWSLVALQDAGEI